MMVALLRRAAQTALVLFGVSVLVFGVFFATPGADPTARIAGRNASPQVMEKVRHEYGFDRPLPVQYAIMMKKLFITRDLASYANRGQAVVPGIMQAAPVTACLVGGAAVIWVTISIAMGTLRRHEGYVGGPQPDGAGAGGHFHTRVLAGTGDQSGYAKPLS